MKAITVKQPWASLIFINNGYEPKNIENRTWNTNVRGRVLIHSSAKHLKPQECNLTDMQWDNIRGDMKHNVLNLRLPTSSIIGSVEIVDCVVNHDSIWAEKTPMAYLGKLTVQCQPTIYNWVLANPILFPEPIPAKGRLNFWDYPNILAEPEEKNGPLFCHCQLTVKEINQVAGDARSGYYCRYCGGKWYK